MVREILTVNVGQCGLQLGATVWQQYCAEHSIDVDGSTRTKVDDKSFLQFFEETTAGQFVPRNLMVDLEPNVIDDIKASKYGKIFHPACLLHGNQDAANNFARGHYSAGADVIDQVSYRLRKLAEHCDNLQGFILTHSVGGGTGSGLGALILEEMANGYRKKQKMSFDVFPSPNISTCVLEPYNSLLSMHSLIEHTHLSMLLDNEAIYDICQKSLELKRPSYDNLNRLVTKVISSITSSLRFEGELNFDLAEFETNLVPFPRLHFMITSMAPVWTPRNRRPNSCAGSAVQNIFEICFAPESFFTRIPDFDREKDKYMAISVNWRGDVKAKEANATISWSKAHKIETFVEWCPTSFRVNLCEQLPAVLPEDDIASEKRNLVMIGNNCAIGRVHGDRIRKKYDVMYSQRAFVHWYVNEGMEEGEFAQARENLLFLERDYLDVLSEQPTDDTWDDSDY